MYTAVDHPLHAFLPGFAAWEGDKDMGFWNDGLTLLKVSQVDYVLFYRLLGERVDEHMNTPAGTHRLCYSHRMIRF
jgi:hypothetical protein